MEIEVLRDLEFCYSYIDDILVASGAASAEKHLKHLKILFERLQDYGVVIKSRKVRFWPAEDGIPRILCIRRGDSITAGPSKSDPGISDAKDSSRASQIPRHVKFYRKFLPKIAEMLVPLNDLLQGNVKGKVPLSWSRKLSEHSRHQSEV